MKNGNYPPYFYDKIDNKRKRYIILVKEVNKGLM